jgi:hypothetical protein
VLRVLEPALRMKAQTDFNSRGRKDFICREFSWRKEKRKTAYWRMQGDPETGDPLDQGGERGFIAYLHCLMAEMPFRCKWAFPRDEKCLLDHLSPFGTSRSPSFSPSLQQDSLVLHAIILVKFGLICNICTKIVHILKNVMNYPAYFSKSPLSQFSASLLNPSLINEFNKILNPFSFILYFYDSHDFFLHS